MSVYAGVDLRENQGVEPESGDNLKLQWKEIHNYINYLIYNFVQDHVMSLHDHMYNKLLYAEVMGVIWI